VLILARSWAGANSRPSAGARSRLGASSLHIRMSDRGLPIWSAVQRVALADNAFAMISRREFEQEMRLNRFDYRRAS
jgi:hypothetical protein